MVMADRIAILDAGRIVQIGAPEELYNRPNSPFVASFMGAANAVRLAAERSENGLRIAEGPHNSALAIAADALDGSFARLAGLQPILAYFRSADARLQAADGAADGALVLRGEIVQASYPGGCYRYAVRVGGDQLLVDDEVRHAVGAPIGVRLRPAALHLYPEPSPATAGQAAIH